MGAWALLPGLCCLGFAAWLWWSACLPPPTAVWSDAAPPPRPALPLQSIGLPVLNGWGLSETSPVLACRRNLPRQNVRGSVGE